MNSESNRFDVRQRMLRLIDVMYGVLLAYGFNFIDQAKLPLDYIGFLFAYAVIIIDWIFSRNYYATQRGSYSYLCFLLDIVIVFVLSRLFSVSIVFSSSYLWWLAALFALYILWDIISLYRGWESEYDLRYSIGGDTFALFGFILLAIFVMTEIRQNSVLWNLIPIIVYTIAVCTWLKKTAEMKLEKSDTPLLI